MSVPRKICVLGLGYIGLPTALLLAKAGHRVVGVDTDFEKINLLKNGQLYFDESGLDELFSEVRNAAECEIDFVEEPVAAEVYIIAVPTPTKRGTADLEYVFNAIESIKLFFKDGATVILESTVGPRDCTEKILPYLAERGFSGTFALCTERAIPGNTLAEMVQNDRVIGFVEGESNDDVISLYKSFVDGEILTTDVNTAAAAKLIENTYRAVNIAFANELLKMSDYDQMTVDVWEAIALANRHPRVNVHSPGPGVGGHCIPVDPYFLVKEDDAESLILKALQVNEGMPRFVAEKVKQCVREEKITEPTIAIMGYAYKKNVDDCRETPSQSLVEILSDEFGFEVMISDPYVQKKGVVGLDFALQSADIVVFMVDHDLYQNIDFTQYPAISSVIDTKHQFSDNNDVRIITLGKRT